MDAPAALDEAGRTNAVRRFYERAPFPGYPPRESLEALYMRAERSVFARLVHEAIPGDARIVEVGCGTGQMSLYLARADRIVVGAARRPHDASDWPRCNSSRPISGNPD